MIWGDEWGVLPTGVTMAHRLPPHLALPRRYCVSLQVDMVPPTTLPVEQGVLDSVSGDLFQTRIPQTISALDFDPFTSKRFRYLSRLSTPEWIVMSFTYETTYGLDGERPYEERLYG